MPDYEYTFDMRRSGIYSFCFTNVDSDQKVIFFQIQTAEIDSLEKEVGKEKITVNTQMEDQLNDIHENGHMSSSIQISLKQIYFQSLDAAKRILIRINYWSFFQCCVVIIVSFLEIYILKNFFTQRINTIGI
ncbi:hypothetical protein A3Q56_02243 [Intoshia linei]|uniref:GOLD domain-containing protein n=1 Tax=Intoshia linei TaxID=1819745 RepID=A0A177B8L9_9BILA|nr:hypothetical protein A3Q56_02243 [Intoshia linei]